MMKGKYFGKYDISETKNFDIDQLLKHLSEKKMLIQIINGNFSTIDSKFGIIKIKTEFSSTDMQYQFSTSVAKEVYDFLLDRYSFRIGANLAIFNRDFTSDTFGLSKKKIKKKALDSFNYYFNLAIKPIDIGFDKDKEANFVAENRFKTLNKVRLHYISRLEHPINSENEINMLVLAYLVGDIEYYDENLLKSSNILQEIILFENHLSILLSLNKTFQFEREDYFTPKSIAQQIFENHKEEFDSLKQLEFIELYLKSDSTYWKSRVTSVYMFFKKEIELKIPIERKFREIIKSYFNNDVGRLKVNDSTNKMQKKRLEKLHTDWQNFKI